MPWVKGKSGNPSGRPKIVREVQEMARLATPEALNRLKQIMRQQKDVKAALAAALAIIERGYGKPLQAVEHTGKDGGPIQQEILSDTEAARLIAFTLAKGIEGEDQVQEAKESLSEDYTEPTLQ